MEEGVEVPLGRRAEQVHLAEDVDVGDLQVDHGAEGDGAARDELGPVHHEVGVDQEHGAHAEVPRVLQSKVDSSTLTLAFK